MTTEFTGARIAVIGTARSGLAAAEVLTGLGARVTLYDSKPAGELPQAVAAAERLGIDAQFGGAPLDYKSLDYLVTSPGVRKSATVLQDALLAGIPVLGEIEVAYRIAKAPILAVTGTNGKTTTTVLVAEMMRESGRTAYAAGNIAAGEIALPLIAAAAQAPADAVIAAEISSFQLEWVDRFQPLAAALLNITPDHGDRQTWDEYAAAKWRIFDRQTHEDTAVIHRSLAGQFHESRVRAKIVWFGGADTEREIFDIADPAEIALPGRHNQENIVAAAAIARAAGGDGEAIGRVARTFGGVVHRLEFVEEIDGVRYVNNSMCTNVDAFRRSLEALPEPKVVIAGGVFKGDDVSPLAGAVARTNVRRLIVIGRSAEEIAAATRRVGFDDVEVAGSLEDAVNRARAAARPGDTVLLAPACASFDMFRDFEDRGDQFKSIVRTMGRSSQ